MVPTKSSGVHPSTTVPPFPLTCTAASVHVTSACLSSYRLIISHRPTSPMASSMGLQYGPGKPCRHRRLSPTSSVMTQSTSSGMAPRSRSSRVASVTLRAPISSDVPWISTGSASTCTYSTLASVPPRSAFHPSMTKEASRNLPAFPVQYSTFMTFDEDAEHRTDREERTRGTCAHARTAGDI